MICLKQTIPLQIFKSLSTTNFIWSILEYFAPYDIPINIITLNWNETESWINILKTCQWVSSLFQYLLKISGNFVIETLILTSQWRIECTMVSRKLYESVNENNTSCRQQIHGTCLKKYITGSIKLNSFMTEISII